MRQHMIGILLASSAVACQQDSSLRSINSAPNAEITSHTGAETVLEGYAEIFRGIVDDPDGTPNELTVVWYQGPEILCPAVTPEQDGTTFCEVLPAMGASNLQITLQVQDEYNAGASDSLDLTVTPTASPEATIPASAATPTVPELSLIPIRRCRRSALARF